VPSASHPDSANRHATIAPCPAGQARQNPFQSILKKARRRAWIELAWKFPGERECLASFLALETAEVLAGAKPANLIRVVDREQLCGHNLYRLWKRYGEQLLADSGLCVATMRENGCGILLLFYRPQLLETCLTRRGSAAFLKKAGYGATPSLEGALRTLRERFAREHIPHEVGVFLGYPLRDVAAFIGWSEKPYSCQSSWMIFGDPRRSLALAETFNVCRRRMAELLLAADNPLAVMAMAQKG
jgi:hypothetical protein